MEPSAVKVLRGLGISAGGILLIAGVAVSFYAYSKYLEAVYLKLQIKQIKKDLGIEEKPTVIDEMQQSGKELANRAASRLHIS